MKDNAFGIHNSFVGKLVGLYYDDQGNPTKHLKGAEAKAARGAQLLKKQKQEEDKLPSCNSKWSQGEGGEVHVLTKYLSWSLANVFLNKKQASH